MAIGEEDTEQTAKSQSYYCHNIEYSLSPLDTTTLETIHLIHFFADTAPL